MNKDVSNKEKFIWNMLGGLSNSFMALILSIVVNRILGGEQGGMFAFAYANAQLMYTIGGFEVRAYQATDVKEKYKFQTYFFLRIFTCICMLAATGIYLCVNHFSVLKSCVVLFLVLYRMVEAFTDVYGGRFQQKDRIDLSGKTFFTRNVISMIVFILSLVLFHNLMISTFGMFISSFLLFFINDSRFIEKEDKSHFKFELDSVIHLLKDVFPLFIGAFIMMYITNAPKYAIDKYFDDSMQNIYNILFMPAFVISMFSLFVFRPMLVSMAVDWENGNVKHLRKSIYKIYLVIIGLTVAALIGTWLLGIPILSALYGINLKKYKMELMFVMLTGGVTALLTFQRQVVTIMRKQKTLLIGYVVAFLYSISVSYIIVRHMGIHGAILTYGISMMILVLICFLIITHTDYMRGKEYESQ